MTVPKPADSDRREIPYSAYPVELSFYFRHTADYNGVPLAYSTTVAGATNYFSFTVTQTNAGVLFELYNLNGNGILNLQQSSLPATPPYFANSAGPGTN